MGQVQSAEETAIDGYAADAAVPVTTGTEDASGTGETSDREAALGAPPVPLRGHTDRSPLGMATPSKSAIRPPVEQGDMAAKRERSTHRDVRRVKREEETPSPVAATHTTNERRVQRLGRPRSRRSRHERGADRSPSPVALVVSAGLAPPNVRPPHPGDVAAEAAESWSSEPESSSTPRATILAVGSRMRRLACAAVVTCCFVAVVAALTYGTIKSIGHQGRIVEEFNNRTIARMARSGAAAAGSTTATTSADVDAANFFEAGANLTFSDEPPTGKRN